MKKCYVRPLAYTVILLLMTVVVFRKPIGHGLSIGINVAADLLFVVFLAGAAATLIAVTVWWVRALQRRQAERGACLSCDQNCDGKQDAKATIVLHKVQPRDENHRPDDLPALPVAHAPYGYPLAAGEERPKEPVVGQAHPPASRRRGKAPVQP